MSDDRVIERECEVRLTGGPKDEWVYRFPMHWEVEDGILVWRPPDAITAGGGQYVPINPKSPDRPFVYEWRPA